MIERHGKALGRSRYLQYLSAAPASLYGTRFEKFMKETVLESMSSEHIKSQMTINLNEMG